MGDELSASIVDGAWSADAAEACNTLLASLVASNVVSIALLLVIAGLLLAIIFTRRLGA